MIISMIAALAANRIIGKGNNIPWHLPIDISWFKFHTLDKPIIMGRKTFESIGNRPLLKRQNIVLSSKPINNDFVTWVAMPEQALAAAGDVSEVMIIGGGKIYETFLPYAKRLYLTHIDIAVKGNISFPDYYQTSEWRNIFGLLHKSDEYNKYNCYFEIIEKQS